MGSLPVQLCIYLGLIIDNFLKLGFLDANFIALCIFDFILRKVLLTNNTSSIVSILGMRLFGIIACLDWLCLELIRDMKNSKG